MNRKELEQCNNMLDRRCVELEKECDILKGLISNMIMNREDETLSVTFKLMKPEPIHIKIDNGMCVITRGGNDNATMQEENSEVCEPEYQDIEEGRHETEASCCD